MRHWQLTAPWPRTPLLTTCARCRLSADAAAGCAALEGVLCRELAMAAAVSGDQICTLFLQTTLCTRFASLLATALLRGNGTTLPVAHRYRLLAAASPALGSAVPLVKLCLSQHGCMPRGAADLAKEALALLQRLIALQLALAPGGCLASTPGASDLLRLQSATMVSPARVVRVLQNAAEVLVLLRPSCDTGELMLHHMLPFHSPALTHAALLAQMPYHARPSWKLLRSSCSR